MARTKRDDFVGAWHHVMNRGRNRDIIFLDDEDASAFLDTVGDTVSRFGIEVHAYSLMPNHYHLLVRAPLGNLSNAMKHLGAGYTQGFNKRHKRDGSLFRGRFRSQLVTSEKYLMYLPAYIHLNPLRAGLITRLDAVRAWTSYRRCVGKDKEPDWLKTDVVRSQFPSVEEMKNFTLNFHRKATDWPESMRREDGWFTEQSNTLKSKPTKIKDAVPIRKLIRSICHVTGADPERLKTGIRGPGGNPERRFAVWALQSVTYLTHRQIGVLLEMTPQHVARDVRRSRANIDQFQVWTQKWSELYPIKVSIVEA